MQYFAKVPTRGFRATKDFECVTSFLSLALKMSFRDQSLSGLSCLTSSTGALV